MFSKSALSCFGLAALLFASPAALAVPVVAQQAESASGHLQTMRAAITQQIAVSEDNISGAGLFVRTRTGDSADVTISLFDADPAAGGQALASATSTVTGSGWVDVHWAPVSVNNSSDFVLVFASSNPAIAAVGGLRNGSGSAVSPLAPAGLTGGDWQVDLRYRTFYESSAVQVPVPGTLLLIGAGLAAFAARRR